MNDPLQNLRETDPKKKLKWNEPKEYRRLRAAYTIDHTQMRPLDKTEVMERSDRFFARIKNKRPQYI